MAMKPLKEVLAAMGSEASTREKVERLQSEIEKLGDPQVSLLVVIDEYVTDVSHLLIGLILDLANDVGALPEGREAADVQAHEAIVLLKTLAVYRACEEAEGGDDGDA